MLYYLFVTASTSTWYECHDDDDAMTDLLDPNRRISRSAEWETPFFQFRGIVPIPRNGTTLFRYRRISSLPWFGIISAVPKPRNGSRDDVARHAPAGRRISFALRSAMAAEE